MSRSNAPPVSDGLSIQPLFPELLLWPSILSLDAPVVAIVWQALAAHILNIRLGPYEPAILAFTIWFLYVADHLLDAMKPAREPWEPARRRFYRRHIRAMQITGICSAIALLPLAHASLSPKVFSTGLKIALTVACYFIAIHLTPPGWRERWPREAAVALIFACGTFMPLWVLGEQQTHFLLPCTALFLLLCWLNISAIETWEWQRNGSYRLGRPHASTRWVAEHFGLFSLSVCLCSIAANLADVLPRELTVTFVASSTALYAVARLHERIRNSFLGPVTDLALYSPVAVLLYLWLR